MKATISHWLALAFFLLSGYSDISLIGQEHVHLITADMAAASIAVLAWFAWLCYRAGWSDAQQPKGHHE